MKKPTSKIADGVFFRLAYFDIVLDINAAIVMSQIHYWYMPTDAGKSKLRVWKNGSWWLVKSAKDWWEECRLTDRQVDRAIGILIEQGLIRVEVHRFNSAPTRHIICDVLNSIPLAGRLDYTPAWDRNHPQGESLTDTTTKNTTETLESVSVPETTPANPKQTSSTAGKSNPKSSSTPSQSPSPEDTMNADDILQKHKKTWADALAVTPPANNPSAVIARWRNQCVGAGMGVKGAMTGKESGQFKLFFKAVGAQSNEVVDYVFANWMKFTGKVGAEKGVELLPQSPVIGFVLQHYEIALQLIAKASSQQQPAEKLSHSFDKPDMVCNPVELEADETYVPTADDLQSAFDQLAAVTQKN